MSRRSEWERVYQRFDPERPAEQPSERVDRPESPAGRIVEALNRPFGQPRVLFTGTVGTGKTTELLRVAEARKDRELVVFLDLQRHFSDVIKDPAALEHISAWEVVFLAGLALVTQLREAGTFELPEAHLRAFAEAWSMAAKRASTPRAAEVDVGSLTKGLVALASGGAALAAGPAAGAAAGSMGKLVADVFGSLKLNLPFGRSQNELLDQDPEAQTLLGSLNVLVGFTQHKHRRVLLVIDGLDRIREIGRAKALFVDSQMIAQIECPTIVCGPFALRHHPSTAAIRGFTSVSVLVNAPVLLQSDPSRPGAGVDFFCDLFARRVEDLGGPELIPRELLVELAYRSGGRARDFVRIVRDLASECWQDDAAVATPEIVKRVLRAIRLHYEMGLHRGHIDLLKSIAEDPEHRLPSDPLAQELLSYGTLLPYPNESEWFYPHPLLTMNLVKVGGSTRSSSS